MKKFETRQECKKFITIPRKWFPLWILDWYILREFMIKYCILMLVFIILFILADVYNDISDFLESAAPFSVILHYLLLKLPGNIRFILPISMLLGCMWSMATFGKNLEITAMRASGVSLFRCGVPIFFVGVCVTALNIYFNEYLVPHTSISAEKIYSTVAERRENVQHLLVFRSADGKRNWLFKTFVKGNVQKDVTLKTFWTGELMQQLFGTPGNLKFNSRVHNIIPSKAEEILKLDRNGQQAAVFKALNGRKVNLFAKQAVFDSRKGSWSFHGGHVVSFDRKDEYDLSASRGTSAVHPAENYRHITFAAQSIPERPADIINAVQEKDGLATTVILDLLRRNTNMPDRVKCIYQTILFYRISFPWACLIAVFLGIPLATRNERTGSLMAVISAVIMIVAYIVIAQVFLILGKAGMVPPFIAGTLPTVAFILFGIWRVFFDRN